MTEQRATVWTYGYFPFVMGGSVWQPIKAECKVDGPHDLGKGFKGWLVLGPDGMTRVAEVDSGGLVGDSLEAVRADIAACDDVDFMTKQIFKAKREADASGHVLTEEDFWHRVAKAVSVRHS